ncbi:5-formyltetrahydrofolate cyclo-ligase [Sneathiella sp. P13V-1]|uniref:5-formyltetrahydrofolate cyclo-ligase n=1 Tax=Sneathiella sp. P13V-1 TaxID=2697366 RepID=UPI00187BA462|nr:5-formyltetrahydrofolate cyclo-ligase [Sneathiella sp. P13V-1]MBE7637979.1 5-formyltetrahydrofolate cyclo-ligase [Sneathiella sp. P13V-1]
MSREVEKKRLREKAKLMRDQINDPKAGQRAADLFLSEISLDRDKRVGGYYPYGSELNCLPLIEKLTDLGIMTSLPVVHAKASPLIFRKWQSGDVTYAGAYGIPTPTEEQSIVEPDLLLVPMLAFDGKGGRLGYGGGFYDRTLEKMRKEKDVIAVGYAYAEQEVDHLITDTHDQPLDWMVTDKYVRKFR